MNVDSLNATVMVVDDTPANLKLLEELLVAKNYRVLEFPNGAMALAAAAREPPDLILLDIMMPGMDGFEVCRRLKADPGLRDIPVIFISAAEDTANKIRAFGEGGVDYVSKPFQEEEVLARVNAHINLRRMRIELEKHNFHLEELVQEKIREISDSQLSTIVALSKLAEYRDDDTGQHIERTRTYCRALTEKLRENPRYGSDISDAYVENIDHAASLHDIGKVGISDSILLKPGKLTPDEFETMKIHTLIGAKTLQSVKDRYPQNTFIDIGIALTRSHHEKWDGSGYPDGLAGEDIHLCGRIMAVADVYDALRSRRPYKEPFSHDKSCEIIREGSGRHFDPAVVKAFLALERQFAEVSERMRDGAS
jgi:putative two-component system response regulator